VFFFFSFMGDRRGTFTYDALATTSSPFSFFCRRKTYGSPFLFSPRRRRPHGVLRFCSPGSEVNSTSPPPLAREGRPGQVGSTSSFSPFFPATLRASPTLSFFFSLSMMSLEVLPSHDLRASPAAGDYGDSGPVFSLPPPRSRATSPTAAKPYANLSRDRPSERAAHCLFSPSFRAKRDQGVAHIPPAVGEDLLPFPEDEDQGGDATCQKRRLPYFSRLQKKVVTFFSFFFPVW